jgi:hypothetical protein
MPDATPQGDNEPDAEAAPAAQQIQPTPVDDYPEIELTPLNHHRVSSDSEESITSIHDPGDDLA